MTPPIETRMTIRRRHFVYAVLAAPPAAVLVAWLGIFNVGAASGHWAITDWFLHFAMRSSVRTAALGEPSPPLPRSALRPAAGHYDRACAVCHGAPGQPRSPTVLQMLPRPPDLAPRVDTWTDTELHRIVMHGVRFTGMPAWPAQARRDEGWMMVALLRAMPSLAPADYDALLAAPQGALPDDCSNCHGPDGRSGGPYVPRLAGQNAAYLLASLDAYASGRRASGIMRQAMTDVGPEKRAQLAHALAAMSWQAADAPAREVAFAPPEVATRGRPEHGVPACLSCHGEQRPNPAFPILDGQPAPYIATQLRLFRDAERGGGPYAPLMTSAARGLADADIEALAAWFSNR